MYVLKGFSVCVSFSVWALYITLPVTTFLSGTKSTMSLWHVLLANLVH